MNLAVRALCLFALCVGVGISTRVRLRVILTNGENVTISPGGTGTNKYKVGASKVQMFYTLGSTPNTAINKVTMKWNGWFARYPARACR